MTKIHGWTPTLSVSYRRQWLDRCLTTATPLMQGLVLDVGGKRINERGAFRPPQSDQWYALNITRPEYPHVISDAHHLPVEDACADTLICTEVLEHVADPQQVVAELSRILRPGGHLILSIPFLIPVHGDPFDFQRFTPHGLSRLLTMHHFEVLELQPMGLFFTTISDLIRFPLSKIPSALLRWSVGLPFMLLATLLVRLDDQPRVRQSPLLSSYTTGYFVIARKKEL